MTVEIISRGRSETPFVYSLLLPMEVARIAGGTHNFEVNIHETLNETDQLNEFVSRINTYCETLPGWNLSTSVTITHHDRLVRIVEASPASVVSQVDDSELPHRLFDGTNRNWDANLFLPEEGHFLVEITVTVCKKTQEHYNAVRNSTVSISLDCYVHSCRGAKAVEKIRIQIQGELSRSNRRWRRFLKRQAEQAKSQQSNVISSQG